MNKPLSEKEWYMESDAGTSNEGYFLTEDVRSTLKDVINEIDESVNSLDTFQKSEVKEIIIKHFGEEVSE